MPVIVDESVKMNTEWMGSRLRVSLEFELGEAIRSATLEQTGKAVAAAVVDELSKSPDFQKGIRDLAVKKIVELLSN